MAQNPVINKFDGLSGDNQGGSAVDLQKIYEQPAFTGQRPTPPPTRYMSLDDVVVRTGAMLGVLLVAGRPRGC